MQPVTLTLTHEQRDTLISQIPDGIRFRGSYCLVASIAPEASRWTITVHALPAERREAIRAACAGTLTIKRKRSLKP